MDCCDTKFKVFHRASDIGRAVEVKARFPSDAVRSITGWPWALSQDSIEIAGYDEAYRVRGKNLWESVDMIAVVVGG